MKRVFIPRMIEPEGIIVIAKVIVLEDKRSHTLNT